MKEIPMTNERRLKILDQAIEDAMARKAFGDWKREDIWGMTQEKIQSLAGRDKAFIRFVANQSACFNKDWVRTHMDEFVADVYKAWLESNE